MNTPALMTVAQDCLTAPQALARPYPGGRAQAESGSKIIENDHDAWKAVCLQPYRLPADHPLLVQFTDAWHAVSALGLGDDAGSGLDTVPGARPRGGPFAPGRQAGHGREAQALLSLWRHASIHGDRLYATGLDRFPVPAHPADTTNSRKRPPSRRTSRSATRHGKRRRYRVASTDVSLARRRDPRASLDSVEEHGLIDGPGQSRNGIAHSRTMHVASPTTCHSECRPPRSLCSWNWPCTLTSTPFACITPPLPSRAGP